MLRNNKRKNLGYIYLGFLIIIIIIFIIIAITVTITIIIIINRAAKGVHWSCFALGLFYFFLVLLVTISKPPRMIFCG